MFPVQVLRPPPGDSLGEEGRMEELPVAKLRVSTEEVPFRWMTGTQSHEGMAGTKAAIDHIAWIGEKSRKRRTSEKRGLESSIHCYRRA